MDKEYLERLTDEERKLATFLQFVLKIEKPKQVLEIGSGWGIFSGAVVRYSEAHLTTIDIKSYALLKQWKEQTKGYEKRITAISADSHIRLPEVIAEEKEFDMVYVDGDHTEEGAKKDLLNAWALLRSGGMMLIDDVFHKENWSYVDYDKAELNFGVAVALWSFIQAHSDEFDGQPLIHNLVHGFVTIKKR